MSNQKKKGMNLPNKLTVLRVCLVPVFIVVMMVPASVLHPIISGLIGVAIFIAASFTDMLDGKIARKYGLVTDFGKKNRVYRYDQITGQLLYRTNDAVIVELHMDDGGAVAVHSTMEGAYPFLDAAFAAWCRQKGVDVEHCDFDDPGSHLWFPVAERKAD